MRDPTSEQSFEPLVVEGDCIVSCSVSRDGSRMLLNLASRAVHLWKIPGPESQEAACLLQRFRGPKERQSRWVPTSPSSEESHQCQSTSVRLPPQTPFPPLRRLPTQVLKGSFSDARIQCSFGNGTTSQIWGWTQVTGKIYELNDSGRYLSYKTLSVNKACKCRYVVRSCFGGYNDCYVLSGSEECKVQSSPLQCKLPFSLEGESRQSSEVVPCCSCVSRSAPSMGAS